MKRNITGYKVRISTYNSLTEYKNPEHNLLMKEYDMFFNGYYCTYWGCGIAEYPSIPRVNEEVEDIEVDGRSGSLTIKKGTYRDRTLKFKFRVLDHINFWSRIEEIEEWLIAFKDNRLFYDRVDRCFVVKRVLLGDITKEVKRYGEFEVTFVVNPFMEDLQPYSETFLENEKVIINRGHFETTTEITLYGNGTLQITINDTTTEIRNVVDQVTLDSELMICRDKNGNNKLNDMVGSFPTIDKGENNITVNSNVIKTSIKFSNYYR